MYVPGVITRLDDAWPQLEQQEFIQVNFNKPYGGFLKISRTKSGQYSLELSGNQNLLIPFTSKSIRFLEYSMGWKQNSKTTNFKLNLSGKHSQDEVLGIVLWSLECSFKEHIRRPMDSDYWPNFEEVEEMLRRSYGRRHQKITEKRLAK
jgi:hypothetical protein